MMGAGYAKMRFWQIVYKSWTTAETKALEDFAQGVEKLHETGA